MWATIAAVAFAVLVQALAVAFFFGRLFERQNNQHARIKRLEESDGLEADGAKGVAITLARLEATIQHLAGDVGDIKTRLGWPAGNAA